MFLVTSFEPHFGHVQRRLPPAPASLAVLTRPRGDLVTRPLPTDSPRRRQTSCAALSARTGNP
jgi:hypothetical protein